MKLCAKNIKESEGNIKVIKNQLDGNAVEKQFDSFCKLVIVNTLRDLRRHEKYRLAHEKSFDDLSVAETGKLICEDDYPIYQNLIAGINIKSDLLYAALTSLPELKRKVILLKYFVDMTDLEIGQVLYLPRTTVRDIRYSALNLLRKYMEVEKKHYEYER